MTKQEFYCRYCNYKTTIKRNYLRHLDSILHNKNVNLDYRCIYSCDICKFKTDYIERYRIHEKSKKHKKNIENSDKKHCCIYCGKHYKYKSGLCKHKRKCGPLNKLIDVKLETITKKLDELESRPQQIINNNTTNNNTMNNTMNIQAFLNNECGNALNFIDFMRDLLVTVDDVLRMGNIGFVESYNELVTNKIVNMELRERPTHCSNKQKLNFYVKHNDTWLQDKENEILKRSINILKDKEVRVLCNHTEKALGKEETNREVNDRINALSQIQKMGDTKKIEKILRETAKSLHLKQGVINMICDNYHY